jgi:hypothetical protein
MHFKISSHLGALRWPWPLVGPLCELKTMKKFSLFLARSPRSGREPEGLKSGPPADQSETPFRHRFE